MTDSGSAPSVLLRLSARGLSCALCVAATLGSRPAFADVSSWMFVGGGMSQLTHGNVPTQSQGALQLDTGFGMAPTHPLVVGFAAKSVTHFGQGTDLGLALRTTTAGYSLGTWGLALDVGGYQRFWGTSTSLFAATLNGGLPWGLTLAATASTDFGNTETLVFALGLDWARLTVHRTAGDTWWRNYRLPVADRQTAAR